MANSEQKSNKNLRVSDVITNEEIETWNDGDIITITAGTGKGKSYFIKNTLFSYAKDENKKILMLIHRTNCVNQFKNEIKRDGKEKFIDIMTYQSLESRELNKRQIDMTKYKYIVCDEFHYFLSDAGFNKTTDISLDNIMKQNHAVRIFMSATGDSVKRYINNLLKINTIDYEIPIDYSFIQKLTFFNEDESLEPLANEIIKSGDKAIFFIWSAKKAYKLYRKFKEYALFNCSKSNRTHYKYVNQDSIDEMLENEKFKEQILITTTCMDAGVNINDDELKHIIVDVQDIGSLIQCIGRKRLRKNEKINVYIKTINNQQLGGLETQAKKNVEMADFLNKHSPKEYLEKYPRSFDKSHIIYDEISTNDDNACIKKVNKLMYFKKKIDIADYQCMRMNWGEFGYCKYLAYNFGFYDEGANNFDYEIVSYKTITKELEECLEDIVGKIMLQVSDRKELIEKINIRQNGKLIRSRESINKVLINDLELPYQIKQFQTSRMINGAKRNYKSAWKVIRIKVSESS